MRSDDTRLNIFVFLVATVVVFMGLVAFARYPSLFVRGREYRAVFRSVAGLNRGDEVRYGGLLVGTITEIHLDSADPTRIEVEFMVRRNTPVRLNTRASISQVGFLGEPFLGLSAGPGTAPVAPEGSRLQSEETLTFQDAMTKLARFIERSDTLMARLEGLEGDRNPLDRLDRTLARVEALIGSTSEMIGSTGERTNALLAQAEGASAQLTRVLERSDRVLALVDTTVRSVGPGLGDTQREAYATLRETRQLVADIRGGLQAQGGVDALVRDLAVATDNLARLTTRLERDPTSILKARAKPRKTAGPKVR